MAAHSYYQQTSQDWAGNVPRVLRWLVPGAILSSLLLIALPAMMLLDRAATYAAIQVETPGLDPNQLDVAFALVMSFAVAMHAVDVVAVIWFSVRAAQGRRWARIALTIALAVFTVGSVFSGIAWSGALWTAIPGQVVHLAMLLLLWVPRSVREFFATHRSVAPGGGPREKVH